MKFRTALLATALLFSTSTYALDDCFSGNWYDPTTDNGEGISIEVNQDRVTGHFYTWRGDNPSREVYTLYGLNEYEDYTSVYGYNDFYFFDDYVNMYVGGAVIGVLDENNIVFGWIWKHDKLNYPDTMKWCIGDHCNGSVELTRLTQPIECN